MWKNRATEEVQVQQSRARHVVSCYIRLVVLVRILYICSHVPTTVSNTCAKNYWYLVSTIRGSQLELVACFQCVSEYIQISFVILIEVIKSFFQISFHMVSERKTQGFYLGTFFFVFLRELSSSSSQALKLLPWLSLLQLLLQPLKLNLPHRIHQM